MNTQIAEQNLVAFSALIPTAQESELATNTRVHPTEPKTSYIKVAFNETVGRAQDQSQSAGHLKAVNLTRESFNDTGTATYTKKQKLRPTMADFVIDVQKIARRVLDATEFWYFRKTYFEDFLPIAEEGDRRDFDADGKDKYFAQHLRSFHPSLRDTVAWFDNQIRNKLGASFIANQLYPFSSYMDCGA